MTIAQVFNDDDKPARKISSAERARALSVAVFCGSREGIYPVDKLDAIYVGRALGLNGITQVYGGSDYGNMGHSSRACMITFPR